MVDKQKKKKGKTSWDRRTLSGYETGLESQSKCVCHLVLLFSFVIYIDIYGLCHIEGQKKP